MYIIHSHSPWEAEHHPDEFIEMYKDCEFESIPNVPDHKDMATGPVYGHKTQRESDWLFRSSNCHGL